VGKEERATVAQAIFQPNFFLYKYLNNLIPIILRSYKAYKVGTECSETSAHKIQKPGNHAQERIQEVTSLAMYV